MSELNLAGLSPRAAALLQGLQAANIVPGLVPRSAYRSPTVNAAAGGANHSQHLHGNALDFSIGNWSDAQRQAFLSKAVELGARGIGIYPNGSLHIDVRDTPTFWGTGGSYRSQPISSAPQWAQTTLAQLFGQQAPAPAAAPAAQGAPTELAAYLADAAQRATLPAGMRNNNPGNIKFVGQNVPGIVGPSTNTDQGDPQAVFDSPQSGMAAMYALLNKKYTGGKLTPNQIIAGDMGWTPGNFEAAANVARTMGIGPNDDIGMNDPARAANFMHALILQEHGQKGNLYPMSMIQSAITGTPAQASAAPGVGSLVERAAKAAFGDRAGQMLATTAQRVAQVLAPGLASAAPAMAASVQTAMAPRVPFFGAPAAPGAPAALASADPEAVLGPMPQMSGTFGPVFSMGSRSRSQDDPTADVQAQMALRAPLAVNFPMDIPFQVPHPADDPSQFAGVPSLADILGIAA